MKAADGQRRPDQPPPATTDSGPGEDRTGEFGRQNAAERRLGLPQGRIREVRPPRCSEGRPFSPDLSQTADPVRHTAMFAKCLPRTTRIRGREDPSTRSPICRQTAIIRGLRRFRQVGDRMDQRMPVEVAHAACRSGRQDFRTAMRASTSGWGGWTPMSKPAPYR